MSSAWWLAATVYRPVMPWAVLVALGGALLGLTAWRCVREWRLMGRASGVAVAGLRGVAIAGLLWMLAGPGRYERAGPEATRPVLNILVDTSASMSVVDEDQTLTRFEMLRRHWLDDVTLARLREAADVRLTTFDETTSAIEARQLQTTAPVGRHTHLLDALRAGQTAEDTAGVTLVLSDGHDTRRLIDAAAIQRIAEHGEAIFAAPVGQRRDRVDLSVQAWAEADRLMDGQATMLHLSIGQRGLTGRRAEVMVREDEREVRREVVTLSGKPLSLDIRVEPGQFPGELPGGLLGAGGRAVMPVSYRVEARLLDADEPYLANNAADVFLEVSRRPLRVLLLEGRPYWDTRFLVEALRASPEIAVTSVWSLNPQRVMVTREDEGDERDEAVTLPVSERFLRGFDVVVLGKGCEVFLSGDGAAGLVRYVREHGGALVLARGEPVDAAILSELEPVMPVRWGREAVRDLRLALTPEGAASPVLSGNLQGAGIDITHLPGVIAATRVTEERAASVVWLRGSEPTGMAGLVTMRSGRGRVLAVMGDGLWQWAMQPPRSEASAPPEGEEVGGARQAAFHLFWSRAVHWLAAGGDFLPGQDVSLSLSATRVKEGEPVHVAVATRYVEDDRFEPVVEVMGAAGATTTLHPQRISDRAGRYEATFEAGEVGIYTLRLRNAGGPGVIDPATPVEARLAVESASPELRDPSPRPEALAALAEATGGLCLGLGEVDPLVRHLRALGEANRQQEVFVSEALDGRVLGMIGVSLCLAWYLRRRAGLA